MKELKVRIIVYILLVLLAIITLSVLEGLMFRMLYGFAVIVAVVEVYSLVELEPGIKKIDMVELTLLTISLAAVSCISVKKIILVLVVTVSTDTIAYVVGRTIGHKVFSDSPFPVISPNKSYEGTIFGIVSGMLVTFLVAKYGFREIEPIDLIIIFGGSSLAVIGDLLGSFIKRTYGVKDFNDVLKCRQGFEQIEMLLGGKEGHGGYLDRIDSSSFVFAIVGIVTLCNEMLFYI